MAQRIQIQPFAAAPRYWRNENRVMAANKAIKTKPGSALTDRASKPCPTKENMTSVILSTKEVLTMTSREIAELTGKDHKNVKRDIFSMLSELKEDALSFERIYFDAMNREQIEYALNRELTETLLTGYSAVLRRKVIARWHELESRPIDALQVLSDPAAMRSLLLTYTEQVIEQRKVLALVMPKAEALDLIATADGMLNLQAAGKALQQQPNKFIAWLRENNWIYKRSGSVQNCARAEKFNAGYLTTKAHTVIKPDGTERLCEQVMVTPKGLAKLAGVFSK